ncbi:MAG: hypothetical protein KDH15_12540 [Rhodocyclaceae bacterium]|nr:hypothetical protein [Rhodocyclaceae bacterium]
MRNDTENDASVLDALIELINAKAHQLRECLGALQIARAPEGERSAVNRAIGLLVRIKIHLRSGHTLINLREERAVASSRCSTGEEPEARVKHAALALLEVELRALEAASIEVVHELSETPA